MPPTVLVLMGSASDWPVMKKCAATLEAFGVDHQVRVVSAHRTPAQAGSIARQARKKGVGVIICAAGLAAHLAGSVAAHTVCPIIGVPMAAGPLNGQDALLATVQMPPGVPVATVGIGAAKNAALLAVQILAVSNDKLASKLVEFKKSMADEVKKADRKVRSSAGKET